MRLAEVRDNSGCVDMVFGQDEFMMLPVTETHRRTFVNSNLDMETLTCNIRIGQIIVSIFRQSTDRISFSSIQSLDLIFLQEVPPPSFSAYQGECLARLKAYSPRMTGSVDSKQEVRSGWEHLGVLAFHYQVQDHSVGMEVLPCLEEAALHLGETVVGLQL